MRLFALILLICPSFLNAHSIDLRKRIAPNGQTTYVDTLYVFNEGKGSFTVGSHTFTPDWSLDEVPALLNSFQEQKAEIDELKNELQSVWNQLNGKEE